MDGDPTMEHYDWNDGWLFCPTFDPALVRPECTGLELESVRIPHTVKALPYNYCNENDHQRLCGYRREFFAPAEWAGRTVLLTFGAIAHDATVFCNGRRLFHHGCGYTAFTVDLTSALHLGKKNVVAVRCDSREDLNIPPFGGSIDYLTYGGIYRAVSLDIKEPTCGMCSWRPGPKATFAFTPPRWARRWAAPCRPRSAAPPEAGPSTVGNLPCPSPAP